MTILSQSDWAPLLWLVILLPPLILMKQWISRHLQITTFLLVQNHNVVLSLYHIIMLPGTIVHELSHWLVANLLFVQTGKINISLLPKKGRRNQVVLGNVQTEKADPIRSGLIGVAPVFGGCAVILLIAHFAFGLSMPVDLSSTAPPTVPEMPDLPTIFTTLRSKFDTPDVWLWLYLVFAVSNGMLPSSSDRRAWGTFLLIIGGAAAIIYIIWGIPQLPPEITVSGLIIASYLVYALGLTILVNLVFMAVIAALELIFSVLTRRKVI